jgi:hypothetical protein
MTADPQFGPLIVGGVVVLHDTWLALVADALSFQTAHLWRTRLRNALFITTSQKASGLSAVAIPCTKSTRFSSARRSRISR